MKDQTLTPARKSSKVHATESVSLDAGIKKFLTLKRQASTSPDKTDSKSKEKQPKI